MKSTLILSLLGLVAATPIMQRSASNITTAQADAMSKVSAVNTILASSAATVDNSTENELVDGACKPVTLIFAKGTSESGNVGDGHSPGPALIAALRADLGTAGIAAQGVDYDATVLGYLEGGSSAGTTEFLRLANLANTQCPTTKIVLGGYSQGGQILHNAAAKFTSDVTAKVAAVVIFGDPDLGEAVGSIPSSKVYEDCHTGDIICTGSGGAAAHLTYPADAPIAAAFIEAQV